MAVLTKFKFILQAIDDGSLSEVVRGPQKHSVELFAKLASGIGNNQADVVWSDTRTLAASSSETLDILGSLTNGFGSTVNIAKLVALLIVNRTTAANATLEVGPLASTGITGFWKDLTDRSVITQSVLGPPNIYSHLWLFNATGVAISSSTDDIQVTTPNAVAVTYDVLLLGRSA